MVDKRRRGSGLKSAATPHVPPIVLRFFSLLLALARGLLGELTNKIRFLEEN
jgi:hypothetical protein